jgi:hypothetical protein
MRLKDYGRNPQKRNVYVQQSGLLLIGVDIIKAKCPRVVITMEPSGIDGYALYERLKSFGYGVCLANCQVDPIIMPNILIVI